LGGGENLRGDPVFLQERGGKKSVGERGRPHGKKGGEGFRIREMGGAPPPGEHSEKKGIPGGSSGNRRREYEMKKRERNLPKKS